MATWPSKSIQARIDLGPAGGSVICAECPIPKTPDLRAAVYAGAHCDCVKGVRDAWEQETQDRAEQPHLCSHFVGASRNGDTVVVGCSYPYSAVCMRVLDREELVKLIGWTPDMLEFQVVREIGFDTEMYLDAARETIFFLGPEMVEGRDRYAEATEKAILGFIDYWEHQIAVARDYLANGRNPRIHEWNEKP